MATFMLVYRVPKSDKLSEAIEKIEAGQLTDQRQRVNAWYESMGGDLVERGNPVSESSALGNCGSDTRLAGYALVTADDFEAAIALAKAFPGLEAGAGVEVGAIAELNPGAGPIVKDAP